MREHRTIGHPVGIRSRPPRHRARCLARPTTPHPFWRGAIGSRSLSVKAPRGPHARGVPRRERLTLLPRVVSRRGFSARRLEDTSFGMEHTSQVGPSVAERHRVRALHHARRAPRLGCAPKPRGAGGSIEHGSALRPGRDTFGAHVAEEVRRAWRGDGGAVVPDSSWRHPHVAPTARRSLETDARGRLAPVSRSRNVQRSIPAHARLPGRSRGSGSGPAETASERASTPSGRPDGTPQRGGSALPRGHRSVRLVGCCRT